MAYVFSSIDCIKNTWGLKLFWEIEKGNLIIKRSDMKDSNKADKILQPQ